jgi:hypothetical protein
MSAKSTTTYSLDEVIERLRTERAKPWNRFMRFVWYGPRRKIAHFGREIRWAWERARHGWDVRAYWATDEWLSRTLGEILTFAADNLHGHPAHIPFDEWQAAHAKAAGQLLDYAKQRYDVYGEELDVLHNEAKEALTWVADYLPALWD